MGDSRRESPYNHINLKLLQASGLLLGAEVGCFGCPSGLSNKPPNHFEIFNFVGKIRPKMQRESPYHRKNVKKCKFSNPNFSNCKKDNFEFFFYFFGGLIQFKFPVTLEPCALPLNSQKILNRGLPVSRLCESPYDAKFYIRNTFRILLF